MTNDELTYWRVIRVFLGAPTVVVLVSAVAYAVTGNWLVSPFGFGVSWAYCALVGLFAAEPYRVPAAQPARGATIPPTAGCPYPATGQRRSGGES